MRFRYALPAGLFLLQTAVFAAPRAAFVAGNSDYKVFSKLDNPRQDAAEVAKALTALGFSVTQVDDLSVAELKTKFTAFSAAHPDAKEIVFYFSGHGLQVHGENYLTGTDSTLFDAVKREKELKATLPDERDRTEQLEKETKRDAERSMWSLSSVTGGLEGMGSKEAVRVVILDSCRDNPAGTKTVLPSKGFARVEAPSGMLIAFAAKEGTTAAQTEAGQPSLYTGQLLKFLAEPGLTAEQVFKKTRAAVLKVSDNRQEPREYSSLTGEPIFLTGGPGPKQPLLASGPAAATRECPWVNSLGMEFIPLPGKPGLLMCRTETRVRDFRAYADDTGYRQTGGIPVLKVKGSEKEEFKTAWEVAPTASLDKPGFTQGEDHPVVGVSWEEANAFNAWLAKKEKLTCRLPTDAEWSAAAGLGKYPWGSAWPPPKGAGNYAGTEWAATMPGKGWPTAYDLDDGAARTAPVASFTENKNGFFDLGGNVWEWCEDIYQPAMNTAEVRKQFPLLEKEKSDDCTPYRVLRGGSWCNRAPASLLSSYRSHDHPTERLDIYGFRVVLVGGGG
jgi:formylglycine-generating enzyme required for sulfatase activity